MKISISLKKIIKILALLLLLGISITASKKRSKTKRESVEGNNKSIQDKVNSQINEFRNLIAKGDYEFVGTSKHITQLKKLPNLTLNGQMSRKVEAVDEYNLKLNPTLGEKSYLIKDNNQENQAKKSFTIVRLPPALNMKRVYSDASLQGQALEIAQTCGKENNIAFTLSKEKKGFFTFMGTFENSYPHSDGEDWEIVLKYWFGTVKDLNLKYIDAYNHNNNSISAVTQLMYSDLNKVGCAKFQCGVDKEGAYKVYYSCVTSPLGPHANQPIYKRPTNESMILKTECQTIGNHAGFLFLCPRSSKKRNLKLKKIKK